MICNCRKFAAYFFSREGSWPRANLNKKFWEVQGTYSAVLRNIHGDDTSFEASYAIFALQVFPHAVGFFKRVPGRRRHSLTVNLGLYYLLKKNPRYEIIYVHHRFPVFLPGPIGKWKC